jgi:hypothetical protein
MLFRPPRHQVLDHGFFRNRDLDFATRGLLGRVGRGSDAGEVLATIARVNTPADWAPQWARTAEQVQQEAERAQAGGHLVSARSGHLRAATYWACVLDGRTATDDDEAILEAFRHHRRAWRAFIACSEGAHLPIDVAYENRTLPGWLLRPDSTGTPRPTLVITNGSDGAISDLWSSAAVGAIARGWNAFLYDGPGQQSMLFEERTFFRHDWEAVLTPVIDTLVQRGDVLPDQLAGYAISQGGYWLPRALTHEHRLRAAIADPGVVDVATSWTRPLSSGMRRALADRDRDRFNRDMQLAVKIPSLRRTLTVRGRPYEHADWYDLYRNVSQYRITSEDVSRITTPVLVTDPDGEQFWPGQSQQLLGDRATLAPFSSAEGAAGHCQPLARVVTENRIFDWLEQHLHGTTTDRPLPSEGLRSDSA